MNKKNLIKIAIVVIATLFATILFFYYWLFGFDFLFEPRNIEITLQKGKVIHEKLSIIQACGHEIGIEFHTKDGEETKIKDIFGKSTFQIHLPAHIRITVLNSKGEVVFENKDFKNRNLGFRYGPDPIKLIAGRAYLYPGEYNIYIHVIDIYKNLDHFDAFFFAAHNPKARCGKRTK